MRLDQLLVFQGLCESRMEAQELISLGYVFVDGLNITKQTRQVKECVKIEVTKRRKFVSRGGDKLESAFVTIYSTKELAMSNSIGKTAIDIGSSTGGFTDCLLSYGVTHVTSVDVGTSQLHTKLRFDERVSSFENTDIRNFTPSSLFDIVVADISFISHEKIFEVVLSFGKSNSSFFLLIKPQFEVGKGNTKKGIVKDNILLLEVIQKFTVLANDHNLKNLLIFPCEIIGGDGNQEYFLYAKK